MPRQVAIKEARSPTGAASSGPEGSALPALPLAHLHATALPVEVRAPLSGVVVPLDAVPDPVFSRRLVGDGVAIDPTSCEVLAPFSGTVTQLHDAHHALAVTAPDGVEVLIHVGLDTVSLKGDGFTPLVARGARVEVGQPLLRFDPELVARRARSLLTVVVVTGGAEGARLTATHGLVEAGKSTLLAVELPSAPGGGAAREQPDGEAVLSAPVALPNLAGLHARPAAVLASEAKKYAARILLVRGADEANAKSVVAVMGLSTKQGDLLRLKAVGPDAREAVAALVLLLKGGCGERPGDAPVAFAAPRAVASAPGVLAGVGAAPGLAIGRVFQLRNSQVSVPECGGPPEEERARFAAVSRVAARQLEALQQQATEPARAQILAVHLALLSDPDLLELTEAALARGNSAAWSWQQACATCAARLERLDNPLLRERAADLRDVGRRLLALLGGARPEQLALPEDSILIAQELTPSELAACGRGLRGLCTPSGSSTSHIAILARGQGLPAVCGIDEAALSLPDGTPVLLDGTRGVLRVRPSDAELAAARQRMAGEAAQREAERAASLAPARTRDGRRIEVAANVRNLQDTQDAVAAGAEGVGLLRSEFMFFDRATAPSEDEQAAQYRAIAGALGKERPLIIRTLDVGGDKPLPYLPLPKEANPFLGLRGIRVSLAHPELFRAQLRAILRAAPLGNVHVMFPMVYGLEELRAAKALLAEVQGPTPQAIKVGVMIEVPSAALIAESLAREVDFFSIGTNDLTQYTLAMDRGHPKLAREADALHPAVLRLISMTVAGAHKHGKWVGVCGGIASDPLAVPVLVGLGVDELSVSVQSVAQVKAALLRWTMCGCQALAAEVLGLGTTAEVHARLAAPPG